MLFKDAGKKIQSIAKFVFYMDGILSTVGLFVIVLVIGSRLDEIAMLILLLIGFAVAVTLVWILAWVAAIFVYGFGQLIDDMSEARKTNEQLVDVFNRR